MYQLCGAIERTRGGRRQHVVLVETGGGAPFATRGRRDVRQPREDLRRGAGARNQRAV